MRSLSNILNKMRDGGLYPSINLIELEDEKRIWEARISYGPDVVIAFGYHPTDALAEAYYKLSTDIRERIEISEPPKPTFKRPVMGMERPVARSYPSMR